MQVVWLQYGVSWRCKHYELFVCCLIVSGGALSETAIHWFTLKYTNQTHRCSTKSSRDEYLLICTSPLDITLSSFLSFSRFLALPIIWLGLLAFFSYEALYLTSLRSFREKFYEVFLGLHIFLQVGALAFLWFHHHNSRPYVLIALGIFLIDRLVFRLVLKSCQYCPTLRKSIFR